LEARRAWYDGLVGIGYPILVVRDSGDKGTRSGETAEGNEKEDGGILCVGSLGPFNLKSGYSLTVENSIYCHPNATGFGLGTLMLGHLIDWAKERGMHTMIAAIGAESGGSLRLHEKFGFEVVGRLGQVGKKFGRWQDLVYMQRMLQDEREDKDQNRDGGKRETESREVGNEEREEAEQR
jgi:phosphinothricin acetyltransferase